MAATATARHVARAPDRVDWWRVVTDLQRAGYSTDRIAAECLRSVGWVDGLKNRAAEPRFADGMQLLGLWADVAGMDVADAPKHSGF